MPEIEIMPIHDTPDCALCGKALQSCGPCQQAEGDRVFNATVCVVTLVGMGVMAAVAVLVFLVAGGLL